MKLFHKASNTQIENLFARDATIGDLKKEYEQPKWCGYHDALDGHMGCWSLMDIHGLRKKISPKFCKNCDCFIAKDKRKLYELQMERYKDFTKSKQGQAEEL